MSTQTPAADQRPDGWSQSAAAYDRWFAPLTARFAVNALRLLALAPGERLLDVGPGPGSLAMAAARKGVKVCTVDWASAWTTSPRPQPGSNARAGQADRQSRAGASFDAACSLAGLGFFPSPDPGARGLAAGVRDLSRAVRPGGQVLIATWDQAGFPLPAAVERALRAVVPDLAGAMDPQWAFRLSDRLGLESLLVRSGLREVTVIEVTHDWVIPDPAALFDAFMQWSAPQRTGSGALEPAQAARAAIVFAEVVASMKRPSGGLRTTALFGHGIR